VAGPAGGAGAGVRAPAGVPAVHGAGLRDDPGGPVHGGGDGGGGGIGRDWRRACWFFAEAKWDLDALGLAVARLVVKYLLGDADPVVVAVGGTFFRRWGRKVHEARWAYDGAARGGKKIAFGNTWVVAAIVVQLPFCPSPVALPVLFRLWRGKGTVPGAARRGADGTAGRRFPCPGGARDRGCRLPRRAAGHQGDDLDDEAAVERGAVRAEAGTDGETGPAAGARGPDRHLRSGRSRAGLGRYGDPGLRQGREAQIASCPALWHGCLKSAAGQLVLVRDPDSRKPYDLGLFALDTAASPAAIAERYSWRWPIEPSNAAGKQLLGVGDACNRVEKAVERTVPSGFLIQTLLITWYARSAADPADVSRRRGECPWYTAKATPSAGDMLARLRRGLGEARILATCPGQNHPSQIDDNALTCDTMAA
jgi:hypothetical protein